GLVLRGSAEFQIERKTIPFKTGDIILINRNDAHRSHSVGRKCSEAFFLYIHESILPMMQSSGTQERIAGIFSLGGQVFSYRFRSEDVEHAILDICRELEGDAPLSRDMVLFRIHALLILLYREFENDLAAGNAVRRDTVHNAGFRDVISAINRDPCAVSSIADLAASAGMSDSHFRKVFRHVTGHSPLAYINARRLRKAYLLIRQGNTSRGAAAETGFENYGHFLRLFRKEFGVGPKELKRSVKKAK
ncbi:MAG: AraC family transcriptional regulator, partial [Spirochaetota bacterium]